MKCFSLILVCALVAVTYADRLGLYPIDAPSSTQLGQAGFTKLNVKGRNYNVKFTILLESGMTYPSFTAGETWAAGTIKDIYGVDLTTADSASADPALAREFDRTSIFTKFGKIWAITQNEDSAGFGNAYLFELSQNPVTGALAIIKAKTLNLGSVNGLTRPCSGYMSPWNTHLGGEEAVVDARTFPPSSAVSAFRSQALVHRLSNWTEVNPYWYGYNFEVSVTTASGSYRIKKLYSMGRILHETAVCFADKRTCISTDDDSLGGVLLLYVADRKNDLSSGKLYAALPTQTRTSDGGAFKLKWIHLNPDKKSVHSSVVEAAIAGGNYSAAPVKFADLFDYVAPVYINGSTLPDLSLLPSGYKAVRYSGSRYEWLKLKPGMGALASRLETRRMAAYVGASTEWSKPEGVTYDRANNVAYMAMTSIRGSMLNNNGSFDIGTSNNIRLPFNYGGAVYKLHLGLMSGVSSYTPIYMNSILTSYGFNGNQNGVNAIPQDAIANPDNVGIMAKYQKLLITEDTSYHENNYLWSFDLVTGELERLFYSPAEAEVTSGYYFPNIGKFSYLTVSTMHPHENTTAVMGYWVLPYEK